MTLQQVEFFNVGELQPFPALNGHTLARIPAKTGDKLGPRGRFIARNSTGAEIRFVTEAPNITVYLGAVRNECSYLYRPEVKVMCGNFEHSRHELQLNAMTAIHLQPPDFSQISASVLRQNEQKGFAPQVWRIVCSAPSIVFVGIETYGSEIRPPRIEEKPKFCCLCYGSSITNSNIDGWPAIMGQKLGIDILNLGLSGACCLEPEIADYLAERQDCNAITLELGINVGNMDNGEFTKRAEYLVETLVKQHSSKPIILITAFPFKGDYLDNSDQTNMLDQKRQIIRDIYKYQKDAGANIHLIEGSDMLDSPECLSIDFVHPRVFGHAVMGLNLAKLVAPIFNLG